MMHGVGKLAVLRSFAQFQNQYNEMLYKVMICIVASGVIDENICQTAHVFTCCVVPVAVVGADVVVQQLRLKPLRPQPPVQPEVLHQEAGHILPASVGHPARPLQLPHVGVNKGDPSQTIPPGIKLGLVL